MRKAWALVAVSAICAPAWAVHKCTLSDGSVVYQDAVCPAAAAASQVRLFAAPSDAAGRSRAAAEMSAAARFARAAEAAPAPAMGLTQAPPAPATSPIDGLAEACLNWYRPMLRDPRGAYWRDASIDKLDVLRLTIHATNGFGGYVAKAAACEVRAGRIDDGWTRTQATRMGW